MIDLADVVIEGDVFLQSGVEGSPIESCDVVHVLQSELLQIIAFLIRRLITIFKTNFNF